MVRDNAAAGAVPLRLVKGSHIVVPRIAGASDGFLLQNTDGRVVFVLPFETAFTLIGTTDVPVSGSPSDATCSAEEEAYLLAAANRFLDRPLARGDIVWRFAGVRPLQADEEQSNPSALSRDYSLALTGTEAGTAMLTIVGGKVTTYRRLAEAVMDRLAPLFPGLAPAWTASRPLPGGDIPGGDFGLYMEGLSRLYAWMPDAMLLALARRHGTAVRDVIGDARRLEDMGALFPGGLSAREVAYLAANEWAKTEDDVLWRRTKAGLHAKAAGIEDVVTADVRALLPSGGP
jgi:glycerol-3-phosphate dehydrogenase